MFQHHILGRAHLGTFCGVSTPTSVSVVVRGTPGGSGQCWVSRWDALLMPEHRCSHLFGWYSSLFARAVRAEMGKNPWLPAPGCIRNGLACLPAAGFPRGLRRLSGGGFAQLLSCCGEATCTPRCRFSRHQNFAVKRRLCLGHHPSPPTCLRAHAQFDGNGFGRKASLCNHSGFHPLLPFLSRSVCVQPLWNPARWELYIPAVHVCVQTAHTHTGMRASHLGAWH